MKKVVWFCLLSLPGLSFAGLMSTSSFDSQGPYNVLTAQGHQAQGTHELRLSHQPGATAGFIDLQANGDIDLSMFLFLLSFESFAYGPVEAGSSEGMTSEYSPGGDLYLGDLIAWDDSSGSASQFGVNPRISGHLEAEAFSVFVVPSGTTESMIREHNLQAMTDLIYAQALTAGFTSESDQTAFRENFGAMTLQSLTPAFCCAIGDTAPDISADLVTLNQLANSSAASSSYNAEVPEPHTLYFWFASLFFIGAYFKNKVY